MRLSLLLALLVLAPAAAGGEIYRWTDAQGRLHFAQRLDQVPERYRAQAQADAATDAGEGRVQTIPTAAAPAAPAPRSPRGVLRIPFERQGHLMLVEALLNDQLRAPLLVDTGASGVALPPELVERLGIPIGPDTPRIQVGTANGVIQAPLVVLDSIEVGGARVEGLQAAVTPSLDVGLLGGAFFNNFVYNVDAAAGVITLRPNEGIVGGLDAGEWRARFRAVREPLAELERYLEETDVSRPGRRAELETRRAELRDELERLEREADRAEVPGAWRR